VYGRWAKQCLAELAKDALVSSDDEVVRLRASRLREDYVILSLSVEEMLRELLKANRNNRMAFDLLMAHYLWQGKLDEVVGNLGRLDDFGYASIPSLYEEAALLYQQVRGKPADLHGHKLSAETLRRYDDFVRRYDAGPGVAQRELARLYGHCYLYYYLYVVLPRQGGVR